MTDAEVARELYEFMLYDGFNDRGFDLGERQDDWIVVRDQTGILHRITITRLAAKDAPTT